MTCCSKGGGEVVDQAQEVGVGLVVGPVRDQAHGAKGHAMVAADLGHGGPFHFDREGVAELDGLCIAEASAAGTSLVGRLMLFNALDMKFKELKLRRDPSCPLCGDHPTVTELIDYDAFCGSPPIVMPDGSFVNTH